MGTAKGNSFAVRVFTHLVRETVAPSFRFPGGGGAQRQIADCIERLAGGGGTPSRERIVDFCVCQVHTIAFFGRDYLARWRVSHSFGDKAFARFARQGRAQRYYEDRWLAGKCLSRGSLLEMFRDRSEHPLSKFIYPESEDRTKWRRRGSVAGLVICSVSTLMWTPFSPVCVACVDVGECKEATRRRYPELYRIRREAFEKGGRP